MCPRQSAIPAVDRFDIAARTHRKNIPRTQIAHFKSRRAGKCAQKVPVLRTLRPALQEAQRQLGRRCGREDRLGLPGIVAIIGNGHRPRISRFFPARGKQERHFVLHERATNSHIVGIIRIAVCGVKILLIRIVLILCKRTYATGFGRDSADLPMLEIPYTLGLLGRRNHVFKGTGFPFASRSTSV